MGVTAPGHAVRLIGVSKSFGAVRAVNAVDLGIGRGETVALLGRNGAGKSTSIAMILGLQQPDAGRVLLFGCTPEQAVLDGRVGAMLQEGRLIPRVTVAELVGFVAGAYPHPLMVDEALELAGLTGLGNRRADKLSGGQAQRVRFALALAGNPELVVLDEPTAALDVEARRAFWQSMRTYARRGNTVLFSTHYLAEADENADRIVVMDHGRIAADGSGDRIKRMVGGNLVSFDLAGAATEGLAQLPGVASLEIRGDRALLHTTDSDATVIALAQLGLVRNLEVAPTSLEDAFLTLTDDRTHDRTDDLEYDLAVNRSEAPGSRKVTA
ncbi:ABC transporter ATP-binding protein [Streptomyces sp. RB6PN25]|uniref:ABC transporter ATP-binding protein n=1 Tax=Streptomyces humicola TaxID=2953240 RepID=A0ABT1PWU9_9ACTN|nr:ABC transporter ATP-binding protein [Streptomyces humicola]MCQ4082144.1 ABC transporter ATP-binding protein [Streptomyces humicola]